MPPPSTHPAARPCFVFLALALAFGCASDGKRRDSNDSSSSKSGPLTLEDIYHPDDRIDFGGPSVSGLIWYDNNYYLWPKRQRDGTTSWLKVEAATGRSSELYDVERMEAALSGLDDVDADEARSLARRRNYEMNGAKNAVLLEVDDDLVHYAFGETAAQQLTDAEGDEELATFSPDGGTVAFVRDHDMYVVDLATGTERRLTHDGSDDVLNGKLDWLYQEELYGRGHYRSYWWSPDSKQIAYLRLDQSAVPRYTIVDDMPTRPEVKVYPYPKAGDPNPTVRLGIVDLESGGTLWTNIEKYAGYEPLIVDVAWSSAGDVLAWQVQDREQRWLELNFADARTGESETILRETTPAWVDVLGSPYWLADGSFLWFSQRTGWRHLYHYAPDGTLIRQVTDGEFEVRKLHGVDEGEDWLYFTSTARSPIGTDIYRAHLDGSDATRLTQGKGTHSASFDEAFTLFLDTWSNLWTPPQLRLVRANGEGVRIVDANPVPELAQKGFVRPELLQVPTPDGFLMEAFVIKPPDFDSDRRYPVFQHTYAGPHAPQVRNRWPGSRGMFWQLLAQKGIVVWVCDNRTASGKGAVNTWPAYQKLAETELIDIETGLAWLRARDWVDKRRIGLNGWSYGGLMVCYAMTHSKGFRMGIAGGSVTDWRNYDTIYTERFMRTPDNNPEGYQNTAPRFAAGDLSGDLLLIHGMLDDNVHPQNTMQFAYELQKAGKQFELMMYPKSKHSVGNPKLVYHMRQMMLDFIERTLLEG